MIDERSFNELIKIISWTIELLYRSLQTCIEFFKLAIYQKFISSLNYAEIMLFQVLWLR